MRPTRNCEIVWLFDIDGTLIQSGGAGGRAMGGALHECFGVPPEIQGVAFAGRTDRGIAEDLLALHGVESSEHNIRSLFAAYLQKLPRALQDCEGQVLPGVINWLERISADEGPLGLLTGNMSAGAKIKLEYFGVWEYFGFGGYGDDHRNREDVAGVALQAASDAIGNPVDPSSVWVVGDTPHDVSCAKAQKLNVLCVASGQHSSEELSTHEPNLVIKSMHDDSALVRIMEGQNRL